MTSAEHERNTGNPSSVKNGGHSGLHRRLIGTVGRYRTVVAWFWQDAYRRHPNKVLAVLTYSGLSLAGLVGAVGSIFLYLRTLENAEAVEYWGYSLAPRESITLLLIVAAAAFLLFTIAFGFRFAGRLQALGLGRSYEEFCSKRAIVLLANHGGHPDAAAWVEKAPTHLQSDPRYCGRVARIGISIVLPVLTFVGTFVLLVILDASLTLVILALMLGALPALYAINVRGARHSTAMEKLSKPAGQARRNLVRIPSEGGGLLEPNSAAIQKAFAKGPIERHLRAYVGRLRASDNSELLTNLLMALGLTVILAMKGADLMRSGQGWSELAAYIIALRFNLQSITQASKILTSINRFYPQVARHHQFVHAMEGLPAAPGAIDVLPDAGGTDDELDE